MTVIVTASGSRTKNPARKVRNRPIIGHQTRVSRELRPEMAASFGGFIGYSVLACHEFPRRGQALDPLPQCLEQHIETRDYKDPEEARRHHPAPDRGGDRADRR